MLRAGAGALARTPDATALAHPAWTPKGTAALRAPPRKGPSAKGALSTRMGCTCWRLRASPSAPRRAGQATPRRPAAEAEREPGVLGHTALAHRAVRENTGRGAGNVEGTPGPASAVLACRVRGPRYGRLPAWAWGHPLRTKARVGGQWDRAGARAGEELGLPGPTADSAGRARGLLLPGSQGDMRAGAPRTSQGHSDRYPQASLARATQFPIRRLAWAWGPGQGWVVPGARPSWASCAITCHSADVWPRFEGPAAHSGDSRARLPGQARFGLSLHAPPTRPSLRQDPPARRAHRHPVQSLRELPSHRDPQLRARPRGGPVAGGGSWPQCPAGTTQHQELLRPGPGPKATAG